MLIRVEMRRLLLFASALGFLFCCVNFLLHRHIYGLGQVLYTYAVFSHQSLNYYEYPRPDIPMTTSRYNYSEVVRVVPRIIHHIYLEETLLHSQDNYQVPTDLSRSKHGHAIEACKSLHPEWEFWLWTSNNATSFVGREYPSLLETYLSYPQTIQRANILRYLLLHHYGGVYLDLDLECREPLDSFLHLPWLTPGAHPAGINNAFMLSKPRHPFLGETLIPRIQERNLAWGMPYVTNMLSTGCMFISTLYVRVEKSQLFILGGGAKHFLRGHAVTPLFEHYGDSSWHRWDAALILWIGNNRAFALACVVGLNIGGWWIILTLSRLGRSRRSRLVMSRKRANSV